MRTKRNREPEAPRPEPWNPEQWPAPAPELEIEPEIDPEPEPEPEPEPAPVPAVTPDVAAIHPIPELPSVHRRTSPYSINRTTPVTRTDVSDAPTEQISLTHAPAAEPPTPPPPPESSTGDGRLSGAAPDPAGRRRRLAIAGTGAAAVIVGVGALGWSLLGGDQTQTPAAAPPASATPSVNAAPPPADADCPTTVKGNIVTGRDAGDQQSGPGVIKAFDHAYYTERSGQAARKFGTRTARIGKPEQMQTFIDKLPKGTSYCLQITDQGTGLYAVELSEIPPGGGEPEIYRQNVQTTQADGKYWIQSIDSV